MEENEIELWHTLFDNYNITSETARYKKRKPRGSPGISRNFPHFSLTPLWWKSTFGLFSQFFGIPPGISWIFYILLPEIFHWLHPQQGCLRIQDSRFYATFFNIYPIGILSSNQKFPRFFIMKFNSSFDIIFIGFKMIFLSRKMEKCLKLSFWAHKEGVLLVELFLKRNFFCPINLLSEICQI